MEASAEMKFGLICSVEDQNNMKKYIDFSIWMVRQLEVSADKMHLGHKFAETPTFVLHATPGSIEESAACYEAIKKQHPQVMYVIHILPSKDSMEYQVLREHTLAGALVGQGVLAENALGYFNCYDLPEVMSNMNQWIGRRLSQITARRTEEEKQKEELKNNNIDDGDINNNKNNGQKAAVENKNEQDYWEEIKNDWVNSSNKIENKNNQTKQNQFSTSSNNNSQILPLFQRNCNIDYRKDNYKLTVATGSNAIYCGRSTNVGGSGGKENNNNNGNNSVGFMRQTSSPKNFICPTSFGNNNENDFEHPVSVVLHSSSFQSSRGGIGCAASQAPQPPFIPRHQNANSSSLEKGIDNEKEVIIKGYPLNFNKFQIASLFSDFRPLNVQYLEGGEALIQFANKFHAVQVVENYNGKKFEDEGFTLQVRSASKEDQLDAVKTKLARLLLMFTTSKAVGKENTNVNNNNSASEED